MLILRQVYQDFLVLVYQVSQGNKVCQDFLDNKDNRVIQVNQAHKVLMVNQVIQVILDNKV